MPFTPLHMGPGIAIKSIAQRNFSLMVFGWSQIATDIQPLYAMITGNGELHGFTHTYLGAIILGFVCALSGKYLGEIGLRIIREEQHLPISWPIAFVSAYIGTLSHVAIDSIMHFEMKPFYPLSESNPFRGFITIEAIHTWCLGTATIGGILHYIFSRRSPKNA